MHCTLRIALTATVILTLPQLASAGPIEWSMRGDYQYTGPGQELYLGAFMRPVGNGETSEVVHAYGQMPEGFLPVGAGSQIGINLGAVSKQGYRFDTATPAAGVSNKIPFTVWVTDAATGDMGHLTFDLSGYLLTGLPLGEYSEYVLGGETQGELILGGNRYKLDIKTGDSESFSWVYADLTVAPVAATPEPGSFALAAIGVCGLGAIRRLRRA